MVRLCSHRAEGFGPISKLASPLPTQCFFDTVLVPLPTWLYLPTLAILFAITRASTRSSPTTSASTSSSGRRRRAMRRRRPSSPALSSSWWRERHHWRRWSLYGLYYFIIGVVVLMESVEVARLGSAGLGVGLLPFVYAGCAAAAVLQGTDGLASLKCCGFGRRRRSRPTTSSDEAALALLVPPPRIRGYWAASVGFWVGGAAVTGVKIAGLVGAEGVHGRVASSYPAVDQFTDLVVLAAFYVIAIVAEVVGVVVRRRARAKDTSVVEDDSVELRSEFDWK